MKHLFALLFLFVFLTLKSQVEVKMLPYAFSKQDIKIMQSFKLNSFNKDSLLNSDKFNARLRQYAFAKDFDVNLTFKSEPLKINDTMVVYYLQIIVPKATATGIVFKNYNLQCGEKIFVFDKSKRYVIGALTDINNKKSGILPVRFLPVDTLIIEYQRNVNSCSTMPYVWRIAAAYRPLDIKTEDCEIDINCDSDKRWQTIKHAVAKIYFSSSKSYYVCSGTLLANTKLDETPYFLTAQHCIGNNNEAQSAVFYFNYENKDCGIADADDTQTISGAELVACGQDYLDFSLLKLSIPPPPAYEPFYAGWDRLTSYSDTSVCIHHPDGDVKKISKDYDGLSVSSFSGYDSGKHWLVSSWDEGVTEGGSSGSGLFTVEGLLIGTLSGGEPADCENGNYDLFQQFYHDWDDYNAYSLQLSEWLDTFDFEPVKMYGYNPYENIDIPKPLNFNVLLEDSVSMLTWDRPIADADTFVVYRNLSVLDTVTDLSFYDTITYSGVYVYFTTTIYHGRQSRPSKMVSVVLGDTGKVLKITHIQVFPNPSQGYVIVRTQDTLPIKCLEVYSYSGRLLISKNGKGRTSLRLDLNGFDNGIYILRIIGYKDIYDKKLVLLRP